jgi:glycosyltransferase involved in cell wall biosynthesis
MRTATIVLAPPWPRSGTGNIIAAQAAAHARRGSRVLLLLVPLGRGYARSKVHMWQDAVSAMRFPGVEAVTHVETGRDRLRSWLAWLRAGRDDSIAISARYAASGSLPAELADLLRSARIDVVHANHVFCVPLARRIAALVEGAQGRRPPILLDTHDVQSDAFAQRRQRNPHSRRVDARADLLRSELALCAGADVLVHLTRSDLDFFAGRLPGRRNALVLPTLAPPTEAELMRRRGEQHRGGGYDFVYVGNRHHANLETVRWLLGEVLPLAGPGVRGRVRIVGTVGALLERRDPALYAANAHLFAGEVPSLSGYYAAAKAVLAPAMAGTGASIKLIEALCAGKPVLATSLALRGMPEGETTADIHVGDTAAAFADAMRRLSAVPAPAAGLSPANAALYDRVFSNARYFAALDAVLDGALPLEASRAR